MATETLAVNLLLNAGQYKREARQAASATGQIGNQAQTTGTATGKLDKQMSGLATTAKFAVAGVAAGAVAKFGKDSVQAFLGFDDAMNQSIAIMGDVEDSLRGDMEKAAREVGKTMRISAEEAAEAYFFLASAGLDAEQSIEAMPQVAKFAQAGMFDMARATDLATDAQSALGLTVDDAGQNLANLTRVTDVFVKANTLANTSVEQISEAMTNRAGAAARALGVDVEEVAAVLAAFADQGVKGAEAGTQFSIVLRDLQTKALENKSAFEEAGIAVFDSQGEFRNFGAIVGDLEGRLDGMSDAQKRAELSALGFTDRSIAALTTLLGTSDAIREYEKELRKAGGTTEEISDNQMESFQGQLDLAKSAVEDLQIELGRGLVPVIGIVANELTLVAGPITEIVGLLNKLEVGGEDAADSQSALGAAFEGLLNFMNPIRKPWEAITEAMGDGDEAAREAAEGFSIIAGEMNQIPDTSTDVAGGFNEAGDAARDLDPDLRRLFGSAGSVAEAQEDLERETSNATRAIQAQFDLIRSQLDPLFALERAASDAADAQVAVSDAAAEYGKDSDEYRQAVIDQQEAYLDLRGAQIDVVGASETTREEFIKQQIELGATREEAELLADEFENLEGFQFTPKEISISTRVSGPGSRTIGSFFGAADNRQHGGPVRAGDPYIVGEAGPELFIPQQSGTVVANGQMTSTETAAGASQTVNVFTLTWGDFVRKAADAGLEIQRYGW